MSNPDPLSATSGTAMLAANPDTSGAYYGPDAGLLRSNKSVVFATLAAAGITQVVVNFDGYGDEGQIHDIQAQAGDETVDLPDTIVTLTFAEWGQSDPVLRHLPLDEAIEYLVYTYLEQTHEGWQDGEGAYGEFVFDVASGAITLDHNDRFVSAETYSHVF